MIPVSVCAGNAGHDGARIWLRVTHGKLACWQGQFTESVQLAWDALSCRCPDSGQIMAVIGLASIRHLGEPEGERDLFGEPGRPVIGRVDEITSAASIIMGQTDAAMPVIVGRGIAFTADEDAVISRLLIGLPLPDVGYDLMDCPGA